MPLILLLAMLMTAGESAETGAIEATIRGTKQPLEVELLRRTDAEDWTEVQHQSLPADVRQVRFDGLEPGVYQVRVAGPAPTERFATKLVVGRGNTRRTEIDIEPFAIRGKVTLGGTELGAGALFVRHREFHWRSGLPLAADGTFSGTMWQRGAFTYTVRGPALPTEFASAFEIDGAKRLAIEIPDGRIKGIVRDAAGAPVAGVVIRLQTSTEGREDHVRLTTGPDGRFDFNGIKYGTQTVRIFPPHHLEPDPLVFDLGTNARQRELDVKLEAGREIAIVVIDRNNDPVANAKVFTVADAKLVARAATDEDGRAAVPVPRGQAATLIVVSEDGPFATHRVAREEVKGRAAIHLPTVSSSLLIRALTTDGQTMPPLSLLMRFNGELIPVEVAEELAAVQGLQLMTGANSEALLRNIPSGSYEFWPYRSPEEVESIVAAGAGFVAPIQVNVRTGENKIAVKFARR